jgi:putative ABC transport system permease protein
MNLILKIAWRNVLRHKGKSLIIGVILFLGALLMTVGNGVISGMDRGLELNIVNGFLGDIVIISDKEKNDNILFKMMGESIETITNYKDIQKVVAQENYVKDFMPVGKNVAMVINEDEGEPGYSMVLGVDFEKYSSFFPGNITAIEGQMLNKDETGILVPSKNREELYDQTGMWLLPENGSIMQDNLTKEAKENIKELTLKRNAVYMGMSQDKSTSDIRLPIKGIVRFRALNTIWGHFSIMDIESYRQCLGYFSGADASAEISKDKKAILAMDDSNLDAMFGKSDFFVADKGNADISHISFKKKAGDKSAITDHNAGTYNLVFVKLKEGQSLDRSVKKLNSALSKANLGVRAVTWKSASGFIGSMAMIIRLALFMFVLFLFFVAIIIIVNTLSMAAIERTTEIGMMRAVGARKSFISGMFLGETVMLSGVFGGIGIITGIIVVNIIPMFKITSSNDLVQLLFGGDTFLPYLSFAGIMLTIFMLIVVTLITVVYPIIVAKSITPLDAIARD